ncbi:MAG TPA: metal-dependent hydrolase [Cytophagales bacterium]|nr:metal-dependent hydrolase [Cytophagales bacterium]HAA17598.1 metal-dependent hydrolase [Cytophagales bacterium]
MDITYFGHASFLVEIGGKKLLFDPFITPNELAKEIDISSIEADYILLSHAHEDHVADFEPLAKQTGAQLISTFEICTYYATKGHENYWPMNHGGKHTFDFGTVKLVNAVHTSTFADGTPGGSPAGFVVKGEDKTFYFAGDTALTYDMKLIAEEFSVDVAIMPIGDNFTMGYEDAVKAADFVGTDHIIGMHYDTFPFIKIDTDAAKSYASANGKTLTLLNIGETKSL